MLSYIQVTVLLVSLEVGWAIPLVVMAEVAGKAANPKDTTPEKRVVVQNTSAAWRQMATDAPSCV